MSKIAAKMGDLNMGPAQRPPPSSQVCVHLLCQRAQALCPLKMSLLSRACGLSTGCSGSQWPSKEALSL